MLKFLFRMTKNSKPQSNGEENIGATAGMEIDPKEAIGTSGGDEEAEAMEVEENTGKQAVAEVEGKEEDEGKEEEITEEHEDSHQPVADEAEMGERTPRAKKTPRKKNQSPYSPPPSTRPQRERKTAERFHVEDTRVSKVAEIVGKKGGGTPLKDIPSIVTKMSKKTKNDDILVMFHSLLYSKRTKPNMLRKNILEFSGFPWKGNVAKEKEKVKDKLERYTKEGLQQLLDILVLPRNGKKYQQIERIVDFLHKPVDLGNPKESDKKPPKSGGKAKIVSDEDKEDEEEKGSPPAKRRRTSSKSMSGNPSGKRKATPSEPILRKRINALLQDADTKKMSVEEVIEILEAHFVGDLHKKKDLIKRLMDESISAMDKEGESNDEGEAADEKDGETKEKEDSEKVEDSLQIEAPADEKDGETKENEDSVKVVDSLQLEAPADEKDGETKEKGDSEKAEDSLQVEGPADEKFFDNEEDKDLTMDESNSKPEPEDEKEEPAKEVGPLATKVEKVKEPEIVKVKGEIEVDDLKTENGEGIESTEEIVVDKQQELEAKDPQQGEKNGDAIVDNEKTASDEEQKQVEKVESQKTEPKKEVAGEETPVAGDQQAEKLPELMVKVEEPTEAARESVEGNGTDNVVANEGKLVKSDDQGKEPSSQPVTNTKGEGEAPGIVIGEGSTGDVVSVEGNGTEKVEKEEEIPAIQEKLAETDNGENKPSSEPVTDTEGEVEAPATVIAGKTVGDKVESKEECSDNQV